jgi:hypothetical protein
MRKSILSVALFALTFVHILGAPNPARRLLIEGYIEQYREIAVMESIRTGIPASIKLSQGLLESSFGQGKLAVMSNNHFGIKWNSSADGEFVESDDDEKDKYGRPKSSKFVKFSSPEESYRQHSDILTSRSRYRLLFTYDRADYRSWALGLKKAGYASDPDYAKKLIRIIEQYNLDRFDIPTQLTLDDTPQYTPQTEFTESPSRNTEQPDPSRQPFPTAPKMNVAKKQRKEDKLVSVQPVKKKEAVVEEEVHVLFEVPSELASKSVKNPIPKRQKK